MDLATILASRRRLLTEARLANTAYAYVTIKKLAAVVRRAGLSGPVQLQQPCEQEERYWATMTPLVGNQSVVDEHFSDEDITALADAVGFATGVPVLDVTFRIEALEQEFLGTLAAELEKSGISIDETAGDMAAGDQGASDDHGWSDHSG